MSLYEPIFTDGGDTLYVMDQIRDKEPGGKLGRASVFVRRVKKAQCPGT